MADATETVQRAMGYRWVEITGCRIYTRSQAPHFVETTDMSLRCFEGDGPTDPLADTPKGVHEFMAILRWADARELGRTCLQRMLEYDYALLGGPDFKSAFLEALAAAIKGEQG